MSPVSRSRLSSTPTWLGVAVVAKHCDSRELISIFFLFSFQFMVDGNDINWEQNETEMIWGALDYLDDIITQYVFYMISISLLIIKIIGSVGTSWHPCL